MHNEKHHVQNELHPLQNEKRPLQKELHPLENVLHPLQNDKTTSAERTGARLFRRDGAEVTNVKDPSLIVRIQKAT